MNRTKSSYTTTVFYGVIAIASMLFPACNRTIETPTGLPEKYCLDDEFVSKIELVRPVWENITEGIQLFGNVESNPDKEVSFVSLTSGVVTGVFFSYGDQVRKGQLLAELQSSELNLFRSELRSLESKRKLAQTGLAAVEAMFEDGISSQVELQNARNDLEVLESEIARIEANLNLYGAGSKKGVFEIKAPVSGVVTEKNINPGSQISPESGALFTVTDLSEVWVQANVYASHVSQVFPGMHTEISTLSYPDEIFSGPISRISAVMDDESKVLKARIVLPNPGLRLKPGMLVDIQAFSRAGPAARSVPTRSLVFDDNRYYVIVYKNECEVAIRPIELIVQNEKNSYYTTGPDTTESVLAKNQLLVFEQLKYAQNPGE